MDGEDSCQWYHLCGAVLRGIAANHNNVDFVLHYSFHSAEQHLLSQLSHQCLEEFEVVERLEETYFISKPPTPTGEVVCVVCQSLCTVQVTFVFIHRNTCEGLNVLACTHPLMCVHVCMQYSCTCVHAVLVYVRARSTRVRACTQYSCTCVHAVLVYVRAHSTRVRACMQYSCHVSCDGNLVR